jgi:hypothetical protein
VHIPLYAPLLADTNKSSLVQHMAKVTRSCIALASYHGRREPIDIGRKRNILPLRSATNSERYWLVHVEYFETFLKWNHEAMSFFHWWYP